jgi:hypothetical protein
VAGPWPPAFRVGQIAALSLPDASQARLVRNLVLVVLVEERRLVDGPRSVIGIRARTRSVTSARCAVRCGPTLGR